MQCGDREQVLHDVVDRAGWMGCHAGRTSGLSTGAKMTNSRRGVNEAPKFYLQCPMRPESAANERHWGAAQFEGRPRAYSFSQNSPRVPDQSGYWFREINWITPPPYREPTRATASVPR
jgi:hypothetical protein